MKWAAGRELCRAIAAWVRACMQCNNHLLFTFQNKVARWEFILSLEGSTTRVETVCVTNGTNVEALYFLPSQPPFFFFSPWVDLSERPALPPPRSPPNMHHHACHARFRLSSYSLCQSGNRAPSAVSRFTMTLARSKRVTTTDPSVPHPFHVNRCPA